MNNKQLPLYQEQDIGTILPTGKTYTSFSEQLVFNTCAYKYKLQYIDKLLPFAGSIHTCYGTAIHDAIENYLLNRKISTVDEVQDNFHKLYKPIIESITDEKEKEKATKQFYEFSTHIEDTLKQIPEFLEKEFPGWKLHSAEHELFESIDKQKHLHFKGFIDAVIMVPKKSRKTKKIINEEKDTDTNKENIEYEYHILDHKTSQSFWFTDKRRDFKTQMQLILYKHYFCKKFNIPIKNVKCSFNVIRMKTTKTNKERLQLVPISAGEKTIDRALDSVHVMLNSVKKNRFLKNRGSCKYCAYYNTEHCK